MRLIIKAFIPVLLAVLILYGVFLATNVSQFYFSNDPSSSTVFIENGVSGVVTITDPYLNKTVDLNIDYYALSTGSGVIVTNDGYIITAFHVVGNSKLAEGQNQLKLMDYSDINQYLEQAAVTKYVQEQNPQLINEITGSNMVFDTNDQYNIDLLTQLLAENNLITVKSSKQTIKVKIPSNNPIISSDTFNAQLIDVGNPDALEDVALLKIDNVRNLPFLSINSQKPYIGEKVTIYGYPGYKNTQYQSSVQPTTSTGSLISKLSNNHGIIYYETNADTSNGISGGPVLNNHNEVMGILIYGIQQRNNFRESVTSDNSLFLSSDYIKKICKRNNVPIN
jgi:S1-C subfamily serine protease